MRRRDAADGDDSSAGVDAAAAAVSGAASELPHLARIQESFGAHDVSRVRAHTDEAAAEGAAAIGAEAFATGDHVAFAGTPSLHTAAHEAAHVVQQRGGVQLKGGVGEAGDRYEQHADAVADAVVAGKSAAGLLNELAAPSPGASSAGAVQRREVASDKELQGAQDWTTQDRETNSPRWQAACEKNLKARDSSQYVKIVERRDFYRWFYEHTASRGYLNRWALAAGLVANGAHQIADMDADHALANQALGIASIELQGAMREGNQVIFDNVLPKLAMLDERRKVPNSAMALRQDMQILAEEQSLIQPLYERLSPEARKQLEKIARKQGVVGLGAWFTGDDKVAAGPHNNAGRVPGFDQPDMQRPNDRWVYGMELGDKFTPGGTGFNKDRDKMPGVDKSYTDGSQFKAIDSRANLHELDAWLNPNRGSRSGAGSNLQPIIGRLTEFEKKQILADHSPDGWNYSTQLARLSVSEDLVRQALPREPAAAAAVSAFMSRYSAQRLAESRTAKEPPPSMRLDRL